MRVRNSNIVDLVLSLSPSEKRLFKETYGTDKEFIHLFDCILKNGGYDPEVFKEYLFNINPGISKSKLTPGYLSVINRYLNERVMDVLRRSYKSKSVTYSTLFNSIHLDILIDKGLYKPALKLVQNSKKNRGNVFPIEELILNRQESILKYFMQYKGEDLESLHSFYEKRQKQAEALLLETQLAEILAILNMFLLKGIKDDEAIEEYKKASILLDENLPETAQNKYLFFWARSAIAQYEGDLKTATFEFESCINAWREAPDLINNYPRIFLGTCFRFIRLIQKAGYNNYTTFDRDDFEFFVEELRNSAQSLDLDQKFEEVNLQLQSFNYLKSRKFKDVLKLRRMLDKLRSKAKSINEETNLLLDFRFALACFKTNDFEEALSILTNLVDTLRWTKTNVHDLILPIVTLYLLTHLELSHHQFLKYELKKIQSFLNKSTVFEEGSSIIIQLVNKLIGKRYADADVEKKATVLKQFQAQIKEACQKDRHFDHACEQLFLEEWLEEKIQVFH